MEDRITEKEMLAEDVLSDQNLRPKSLKDYIGQKDVINNLKVFIKKNNSLCIQKNSITFALQNKKIMVP